ncbi:unnamed protein product [Bemisia tabaci]|uniref:Dynein light chain n=1 Tax=Bemisia tabaci TaxID=7038 RepID=A0A9P0AET7_BEMTA|nr:PREDICTED: dynein light chain 4, axonemal [Bemisia tabaci]CAH0390275.1 unnamed protein product [Bemisia tabaci]
MGDAGEGKKEDENKKVIHTYPLVVKSDMSDEMKSEAIEMCVTACEKFNANNEAAAKMIKEMMDKKCGPSWQVVVGEGYGFEITFECKTLLYMFFGGNVAIVVWKCS